MKKVSGFCWLCVVSAALRLPAAYRSGTESGEEEVNRVEGLGGVREMWEE